MNRKELLAAKPRKWDEELHNVMSVYVIPSRRKHDSGYAIMDFVAVTRNGDYIRFGGCCDDVRLKGEHFRMDCDFKSKLLRIWNDEKSFTVTKDLGTIDFIE